MGFSIYDPETYPKVTIRETTSEERVPGIRNGFGNFDQMQYVVVTVPDEGDEESYISVFGGIEGGDSKEEAVFWAERFCSKNAYSFICPEGWEDVKAELPPKVHHDDIYKSTHPRDKGRRVKVLSVHGWGVNKKAHVINIKTNKNTHILCSTLLKDGRWEKISED